ncbi:hypothetical protein CGRA01v4_11822 [Colletotrichum graminicola]|nr:hypothetical protein CGRA01v4_11822 [Colletotrichum graminicola]
MFAKRCFLLSADTRAHRTSLARRPPRIVQSLSLSLCSSLPLVHHVVHALEYVRTNAHLQLCHSSIPVQHTSFPLITPSASLMDETGIPTLRPRADVFPSSFKPTR